MKIIGIDLDNTIVQYDQVIYDIAIQRGLIPARTEPNKTIIRDILRSSGRDADWTDIQGYVYGQGMQYAHPFPGIIPFLQLLSNRGFSPCIISHRTQYPYSGGDSNLHQAALEWLIMKGIVGDSRAPVRQDHVFFELTKNAKYQRIRYQKCIIFIDDLIEFLVSDFFPKEVKKVLFDPFDNYHDHTVYTRITSWNDASNTIFDL